MKHSHEGAAGATPKSDKSATTSSARRPGTTDKQPSKDPGKIADFILFSQREFLLGLSPDLSRENISYAQFYLLSYMSTSQGELTMTRIARKMGHSTAAATGLIDRLEKLGYAERISAADDRRKVPVRITPKGLELVSRLRNLLQDKVAEAMRVSDSCDMDSLIANYRGELGRSI